MYNEEVPKNPYNNEDFSKQSFEAFTPYSQDINVTIRKEFIHEDPYIDRDIKRHQRIQRVEERMKSEKGFRTAPNQFSILLD